MDPEQVHNALENARDRLLSERVPAGHWQGTLSTSALSTATAVLALHIVDPVAHAERIEGGLHWLVKHQNKDGGWGDTTLSFSNISTTLLCRAALRRWRNAVKTGDSPESTDHHKLLKRCDKRLNRSGSWVHQNVGGADHESVVETVKARYGKDRTFSVPILMACALGGLLDDNERDAWERVLPLPFELAALPQKWFAALKMPVVSYALPALIAIGYARFYHAPPIKPLAALRRRAWKTASPLLQRIQPQNGGYLEAAPLTSFVTMALASTDQRNHPVVTKGVKFLIDSVRDDGSWPIDTDLATWTTTLAVKALLPKGCDRSFDRAAEVRQWLLDQQYQTIHPYTAAKPGGWARTDLPGGVPDADDTPGALLALRQLSDDQSRDQCRDAAARGLQWLSDLQNTDGGIPTFCRGWGTLPFDRSSPDLSAHVIRACHAWVDEMPPLVRARARWMEHRAQHFLKRTQENDGSWLPLWFGNQHCKQEANRTYGTACVVLALAENDPHGLLPAALDWLLRFQNTDGGWGGGKDSPSSIEETALAVDALATAGLTSTDAGREGVHSALRQGAAWLVKATGEGHAFDVTPIGFYFAKLWYHERLYPQVWTVSALESVTKFIKSCQPASGR